MSRCWSKALGGMQVSTGKVREDRGVMCEMSAGARKAAGLMMGDVGKVCVLRG